MGRQKVREFGIGSAIVLLLAGLIATGCGAAADGPQAVFDVDTSSSGPMPRRIVQPSEISGNIELMTWSDPIQTELLRRTLKHFSRTYPNVKVTYRPTTGDYPSTVLTRFAGGDAPDVLAVDNKYAPDWIAKGMLLPLDPYLQGNGFQIERFHEQLLGGFQDPAGHLYGIPKDYSTLGLYVNEQMFAAAGIDPPRNWAELRTAARKLTRKGVYGLCIAPSWERLAAFAAQAGGGLVSADWRTMTARKAGTRRAVNYYLSFLKNKTGSTPTALGSGWCGDAFGKGKVAMAIEGNWLLPILDTTYPNVKFHIADLPRGKRQANLAYSPSYSISRLTKDRDAAWVLIQYLTGADGMRQWTNQGLAMPSRTDVLPLEGREAFSNGLPNATVWQLPPGFYNKVLMTAENELTAVIEGDQTVDAMLRRIDEVGTPLLKRQGAGRHAGEPLVLTARRDELKQQAAQP